ncbi:hypothetical protein APV28_1803 [Comamonas testosteroni]|nr:hypothetical protein APV28_1803 [Comamonas testosteroni]
MLRRGRTGPLLGCGRHRRTLPFGCRAVRLGAIFVVVVATTPARIVQIEHPANALRQHRQAMDAL